MRERESLEYETAEVYYSLDEAKKLAAEKMELLLEKELLGATVISRYDSFKETDGSVVMTAEIISVCDIALTREFELNYTK